MGRAFDSDSCELDNQMNLAAYKKYGSGKWMGLKKLFFQ